MRTGWAPSERIVADALRVDLGRDRSGTDLVETFLRIGVDAAVEQVRGDDVDRIFQSTPHGQHPAHAAVGVAGRPIIVIPLGAVLPFSASAMMRTDGRERDRIVRNKRVRL